VVSVFLYLLYFPSYDVINDVIMSDADCTPGREPRSVAASSNKNSFTTSHFKSCQAVRRLIRNGKRITAQPNTLQGTFPAAQILR